VDGFAVHAFNRLPICRMADQTPLERVDGGQANNIRSRRYSRPPYVLFNYSGVPITQCCLD
jgi:hypothetical protein